MQQQAVLACNNALRLLAAALAAAAAAHALAGSEQSTPPCPRPSPLRRLVTVHLGRSRGAETARAAGLMLVVEIRRRRVQHAMSVCVKRQHGAMPAWAMSATPICTTVVQIKRARLENASRTTLPETLFEHTPFLNLKTCLLYTSDAADE